MAPPIRSFKPPHRDSEEPETPSNNLWVGNLPQDVTDADLMELFANYGALDSVTTYSSRSYAFLYFKRVEDATAAKEALQGTEIRGSPLKIEFARPAKPSRQLWVGGISASVSKDQLEEEFQKFGEIEAFRFLRDRNTAFVEYYKLEDATQAMKNMNGKRLGGEQMRVDFLRSSSRRELSSVFRDSRESPFPVAHSGLKGAQPLGGRKDGQPSNVLWIGYPPSVQIDEQMLHNAMILFGEIERIKSFPSRHYSFVEFRSVDEARRAKEGLQGRLFNDPRITIMFSSSAQGIKGSRPDMFNEPLYGPGQMEISDHHYPGGMSTFPRPLAAGGSYGLNVSLRPLGAQGGFDPGLPGTEFTDLNIQNWRRPSSPGAGILPSPASRVRPPVRSVSSGWDVVDGNQHLREPKRQRLDDDDSFPSRRSDHHGLGLERTYGVGDGKALAPVGARTLPIGPVQGSIDDDYIWRGTIAKGGTTVCYARCIPLGPGIESDLPEVVNCSARTGLDMLAKHYAEAIGFDIVFFLPDSEDDFASYTEFLRYLGSKNRAGVAKFDDGTTLFLVPPSDFLTKVLKVNGPERLYGVVLKLPQQVPPAASTQTHLPAQIPPPYIDRHQIHHPEADINQIPQKEEHRMSMDYGKVLHDESKLAKSFYSPSTETTPAPSVSQAYASNNPVSVSQTGVSLTPELIATLASLLPANAKSVPEGGQAAPVSSSSGPSYSTVSSDRGTPSQVWNYDNQVPGNMGHMQLGNQLNAQAQFQAQFQPYPSSHSTSLVSSGLIQDSVANVSQHGALLRQSTSFGVPPQGGQIALSPQGAQQYQLEASHNIQKGYGMVHGADGPGSYSPSVQQLNNTSALTTQVQGANYSQAQSAMPNSVDKASWEQAQHFQTPLSGSGQGMPESEVDKNQRYQSTLQFAANLLMQIQQQQQTSTPAVQGSGNQQ